MRKMMIITLIIFFIIHVLSVPQPKDVKPSADIYEDVIRVLEVGIMSLDEEGYFNGSLFVTRYELAESFSSLLKLVPVEKIKEMIEKMEKVNENAKRLSEVEKKLSEISLEDIFNRIEKTKIEMTAQLEKMESSLELVKGYNTFVDAVKGSLKVQEEKLENLRIRVMNSEKNVSSLTGELNRLSDEISRISDRIGPIERRVEKVAKSLEDQRKLAEGISELRSRLEDMDLKIQEALTASKGAVAKVRDISEFSVKLKNFEEDYSKIKKIVISTNESLVAVASDVKDLKEKSDAMKNEVENLKSEVSTLRNTVWYAVGAGIIGASLGLLALIMLWQKGGI